MKSRRRRRFALAASVVAVLVGGFMLWQALVSQDEGRRPVAADPVPLPVPAGAPSAPQSAYEPAAPNGTARPRVRLPEGRELARGKTIARVLIPAIGVRAPMIKLGLNRDNSLRVPADPEKTGWWSGGAKPGKTGTAVIVGHVDSQAGPAVFHELGRLSNGDRITVVHHDGSRADFVVTHQIRVPKDRFPTNRVYDKTTEPTVRLVTCGGAFDERQGHYRDNVVVFGRAT